MTPLVTIYITNYNYGRYINMAISSVLYQTYQNFELFIIDDGSTDNSKEIIEEFSSDEKIDVIYQKNKGLNITNNIALKLSSGKYIMRLDADDFLQKNAIEKMVSILEGNEDIGMVFPDYYLIDAKDEILAEVQRHDFQDDVQLFDQPAHGACTMIRTAFLRSVGGYDESYTCQDGYELWIKFASKYKVTNINEKLFYYRQHGENLTSNENRILETRRDINRNFISNNKISTPKTLAILPIRDTRIGGELLTFTKIGERMIIDIKLQSLLESRNLHTIVLTSSHDEVETYIRDNYGEIDNLIFIRRPKKLARYNVSLNGTIDLILDHDKIVAQKFAAIMILSIEYIFLTADSIDDAINILEIFDAESVISVRPESATFYQHHGNGMVPILEQSAFTQLEREALYKSVGGLHLTKVDAYRKNSSMTSKKTSHLVVDQKGAIGIFSQFELSLARLLVAEQNLAFSTT